MKKRTLWIFKLIVTIFILTYIFSNIPIPSILTAFTSLDLSVILFVIPVILLSIVVATMQLKVFTDNHHMRLPFSKILHINFLTEFYNLFLPSYLAGGVIRWHKLSKDNKKRAEAFAALILNRLVGTLTLALFGFICWKFDSTTIPNDYYGIFLFTLFGGLLCVYVLLFSKHVFKIFNYLSLHRKFRLVPIPIANGIRKLIHASIQYQKLSLCEHGLIFFLSCFWQILGSIFFLLIALSMGVDIRFESLGWIRSILSLLLFLPVSISGFGVREGGLIFLFAYFGISPATAIAFSFLVFAKTLLLGLIGALLEVKETLMPAEHGALS